MAMMVLGVWLTPDAEQRDGGSKAKNEFVMLGLETLLSYIDNNTGSLYTPHCSSKENSSEWWKSSITSPL